MNIGNFWWTKMISPSNFVSAITECLCSNRSVIISSHGNIPWEDELIERIRTVTETFNDDKAFDMIDGNSVQEPGRYLFEKYCTPSEKKKYWPVVSYEQFLAETKSSPLHHRTVCISNVKDDASIHWSSSIKEYLSYVSADDETTFILISNSVNPDHSDRLENISYSDYISSYDSLVLCLNISSKLDLSDLKKQYVAELASMISESDVNTAAQLCLKGQALIEDPFQTVQDVYIRSNISYSGLVSFLSSVLWKTQTKLLFPILEDFRKECIEKYKNNISKLLPLTNTVTKEVITDVEDLELGHLQYLCSNHNYISEKDMFRLNVAKNARNNLSHWDYLDSEMLCSVLKISDE